MTCNRARITHLLTFAVATVLFVATSASASEDLAPGGTFTDDNGNTHEGFIEAIFAADITSGCNADGTLYCPSDLVTRAQMASFLARALDLPAASEDYFDDDRGVHEDNINRIAEAGITIGVAPRTFDPNGFVPRDQMASFLARAIPDLDPATGDQFTDDDGNTHEANINILASNGITVGCGTGTYCPGDLVPRDQMASFLGRALDLTENVPPPILLPESGPLSEAQATALFSQYFSSADVADAVHIADCESNLDPDAWNPAGFGGLFQHISTAWDSRAAAVGFAGASIFDAEANTAAAAALFATNGWGPWPACAAHIAAG